MADTTTPPGFWVNRVSGPQGVFGRANQIGTWNTVKENFKWQEGNKPMVFGRVAGTGVGLAMAGDALFRSQNSEGEDRSALVRLGQGVLGLGVAAGSLIAGRGR
jgi:hypothetical protein